MKAIWNGTTIAVSDDTVVVEGNHYFPLSSVNMKYINPSDTKTICPWKGVASYYSINVNGVLNMDAAWFYPEPKEEAKLIRDHIAFWNGVEVVE